MTANERDSLRVSLLIIERILAIGTSAAPGLEGWHEQAEYRRRKRRRDWLKQRLSEESRVGK
jgi:hypothetical protein